MNFKLLVSFILMFLLVGGITYARNIDPDGKIHWVVDLSCKDPTRTLIGYRITEEIIYQGTMSSNITFVPVAQTALLDTFETDLSDLSGASVLTRSRLIELSAAGDTVEGSWNLNSEVVVYEKPSTGCFANRWLGF